jgi:lysophospholipase L1-like esterase
MPFTPAGNTTPVFFNLWGHSYFQHGFGPRSQAGRIDAFVRALVPTGYGDFANFAVTGARLSVEGQSQGGYARVINNILQQGASTGASGPAVPQAGGHIFCYGINDVGFNGQTAQYNAAYAQAVRAVISRARMSWLRPNNWAGAAGTGVIAYGAGFVNAGTSGEFSTGLTLRTSTATGTTPAANSTVTFTLPSDYRGETIASLWIANPGVAGGTLTISGTAGVTGTFSTSNIMVSGSLNHSPVCHRIKGLTAANAGQTIIYTVTASDNNATVQFDSIWGESLAPPPVIWCNTARLLAGGYSGSGYTTANAGWTTEINGDRDVEIFNQVLAAVIAEFDQMVQIADLDGALAKDSQALIYDGLHPNELGAALCADAIMAALQNCSQGTSRYGITLNSQPPGPRYAHMAFPHVSSALVANAWHCSESRGPSTTTYAPVAGDIWALPFYITAGTKRIINWSLEMTAVSTAATTVWFALYDDRTYAGYPVNKYVDTTPSTAVSLPATATVFVSPSSASGSISQPVDPGLYWLVVQVATISTPGAWRTLLGPSPFMPKLSTGGGQFGTSSSPMGFKLTGQPAGPLPKTFPAAAVLFDNAPLIGVKFA